MNAPFRLTPMHKWHQLHGAEIFSRDGWMQVSSYGNIEEEVRAGMSDVGIYDVTALTKIEAQGRGCQTLAEKALDVGLPPPGWGAQTITNKDRLSAYVISLTADRFILLNEPEHREPLFRHLSEIASQFQCAHVNDVTSIYAAIYLIGPAATQLLKKVGAAPVDALPVNAAVQTPTCRVWSAVIHRRVRQIPMWLLLVPSDYGEYVWESLFHAGRELNTRALGALALERLIGAGVFDVATV